MLNNDIPVENRGIVKLCRKGEICHTQVNFNNSEFVLITDEHGQKVKILHDKWGLLEKFIIAKAAQTK